MITEYGIEAKSNSEIISELGGRFKQYRLFSNLTQKEVAVKAGVRIFTISKFEKGEAKNLGFFSIVLCCKRMFIHLLVFYNPYTQFMDYPHWKFHQRKCEHFRRRRGKRGRCKDNHSGVFTVLAHEIR